MVARNEKGGDRIAAFSLSHFFGQPVADLQIFPDFSPFVPVLEGFLGMMLGLAEWMFWVAYCIAHRFECLHHSVFLSVLLTA